MSRRNPFITGARLVAGGSVIAAGGVGATLLSVSDAAAGTTYTVLNTNDSGTGSLRDAIAAADANPGADTIMFDPSVTGTIALLSRLEIHDSVAITGPGSSVLTIDASTETSGHHHAFYMYGPVTDLSVSISGLRITGADSDIDGGAIASFRTNLTLDSVKIDHSNTAGRGGAVWHWAASDSTTLTITNSELSDNLAGAWGGGIAVKTLNAATTDVTVSDSQLVRNLTNGTPQADPTEDWNGGAAAELRMIGDATFSNVTFADNSIPFGPNTLGVAILAANDGDLVLSDCTISGNHADAGYTRAALFIATRGSGHVVTITDSTFSDNTAPTTGALYARTDNDITINNSTFTGNSSTVAGAGAMHIAYARSLTLNQNTISDNTAAGTRAGVDGGGGIAFNTIPTFTISGTIISGNHSAVSDRQDIALYFNGSGSLTATGSMIGSVDPGVTINGSGNIMSTTPGLLPLADNGGRTLTMALSGASAAIDAGPSPVATFVGNEFDQRGTGYARVVGPKVDIGAFEYGAVPSPSTSMTTPSTTSSTTTDPNGEVVPAFTG